MISFVQCEFLNHYARMRSGCMKLAIYKQELLEGTFRVLVAQSVAFARCQVFLEILSHLREHHVCIISLNTAQNGDSAPLFPRPAGDRAARVSPYALPKGKANLKSCGEYNWLSESYVPKHDFNIMK